MKKILIAFDGNNFSEGAFSFAKELNKLEPVLVTAVFVPQLDIADLWSYTASMAGPIVVPAGPDTEEQQRVKTNMKKFMDLCRQNKMACTVHEAYYGPAMAELKKETRFADLLIIGGELFYQAGEQGVNDYLKEILKDSECPILVVPEAYNFPQSNVLTYDGSASSVYAIKQFAYLFPELCKNPSLLIYMEEEEDESIPETVKIRELVSQHYLNLQLLKIDKNRKEFFRMWITEKEKGIIISGSFGRSAISLMFRKSFVTDIIQEHQLPVFIAHR